MSRENLPVTVVVDPVIRVALEALLEVGTSAEHLTVPSHHDDLDTVVNIESVPEGDQLVQHDARERIVSLGTVECDDQDGGDARRVGGAVGDPDLLEWEVSVGGGKGRGRHCCCSSYWG